MDTLRRATTALALAGLALASCEKARWTNGEPPTEDGMHADGWADLKKKDTDAFHSKWFQKRRAEHGDEAHQIALCRDCHGYDYKGGPTGIGCADKGCHTKPGGPEFCGTCHGSDTGPMPVKASDPAAGAHTLHQAYCDQCHDVPKALDWPGHLDNKVDVKFSGFAVSGGSQAAYDPTTKTCASVFCHGQKACTGDADCGAVSSCIDKVCRPKWTTPEATTPCTLCHDAPPAASHERWARVAVPTDPAKTSDTCALCHPRHDTPKPEGTHIDGTFQVNDSMPCWTCHGSQPTGPADAWKIAPIPSLDGSTSPSSPRVGAHQRHLDPTFAGRIGGPVPCATCHVVPKTNFEVGHFMTASGDVDTTVQADVRLPAGGSYDPAGQSCVVYCHWNKGAANPADAPKWTADSGKPFSVDSAGCDGSCHEFPPKYLRTGTPHTQSAKTLAACLPCHPFGLDTHIDGTVELLP